MKHTIKKLYIKNKYRTVYQNGNNYYYRYENKYYKITNKQLKFIGGDIPATCTCRWRR